MMRLTLTWRMILSLLSVQIVTLAIAGVVFFGNARRAVEIEIESSLIQTRALVEASAEALLDALPVGEVTRHLPELLSQPRHVRITIAHARDGILPMPPMQPNDDTAPDWFYRLIAPATHTMRLPIARDGHVGGVVTLTSYPADEVSEVWEDAVPLLMLVLALMLAQTLIAVLIISRGLRPLKRLNTVLRRLTEGEFSARAGSVSIPDLAPTAEHIDWLGQRLQDGAAERRRLSRQVLARGDAERKALARDLHDEFGPVLFTMGVEARAIRDTSSEPASRAHAASIAQQIGRIRQLNRAILTSLRPVALGRLPLAEVMLDQIGSLEPGGTTITLDSRDLGSEPGETIALTLFRVLQETVTNALRHSCNPGRIEARLWDDAQGWMLSVADNGSGFAEGAEEGGGLSGMRERIALLDGSLSVTSSNAGTRIEVALPKEKSS